MTSRVTDAPLASGGGRHSAGSTGRPTERRQWGEPLAEPGLRPAGAGGGQWRERGRSPFAIAIIVSFESVSVSVFTTQ
jgi:hypothetical protein